MFQMKSGQKEGSVDEVVKMTPLSFYFSSYILYRSNSLRKSSTPTPGIFEG